MIYTIRSIFTVIVPGNQFQSSKTGLFLQFPHQKNPIKDPNSNLKLNFFSLFFFPFFFLAMNLPKIERFIIFLVFSIVFWFLLFWRKMKKKNIFLVGKKEIEKTDWKLVRTRGSDSKYYYTYIYKYTYVKNTCYGLRADLAHEHHPWWSCTHWTKSKRRIQHKKRSSSSEEEA